MYVYVFTHDLIAYSGITIGGVILIGVEARGCQNPVHVKESLSIAVTLLYFFVHCHCKYEAHVCQKIAINIILSLF